MSAYLLPVHFCALIILQMSIPADHCSLREVVVMEFPDKGEKKVIICQLTSDS